MKKRNPMSWGFLGESSLFQSPTACTILDTSRMPPNTNLAIDSSKRKLAVPHAQGTSNQGTTRVSGIIKEDQKIDHPGNQDQQPPGPRCEPMSILFPPQSSQPAVIIIYAARDEAVQDLQAADPKPAAQILESARTPSIDARSNRNSRHRNWASSPSGPRNSRF